MHDHTLSSDKKDILTPAQKVSLARNINRPHIDDFIHGNAGQVNYAASKAGLIGLTKSIAKELAGRNITANVIAPGFIKTDMSAAMSDAAKEATLAQIPLKREGEPGDVAAAVAFLASEDAAYITGQVLGVDGGMGI